ncbi:hypothetical protein AWC38_SpisGene9466 [Stylophora pistillata]|uniref:Reverse transcriptase domain-containing protein n=1 Tax=Stylophora pistillata TaxID=50429 RepID=A0A2B4SA00_STYPI|nr:hypothetical protein AWC38_SpisGene9466 [Stylophora pistillata]
MPIALKVAALSPSLKKNDADFKPFSNFPPISNLTLFSKIIEKAVAEQLTDHVKSYHLDVMYQSAFKVLDSTETALLKVRNDILRAVDHNKSVILLLLDLSSAFDTVDHLILLSRLSHPFGIKEEVTEGEWSIDEATRKLQSSEAENYWKVAFEEGLNLDEKILEGHLCKTTTEDFKVRYDFTYLTPCGHQVRCKKKSWVLPGKAVASIQPQGPSVGSESDMLQVPFAQGGNPGYCQVQVLVAEQFEGEFNQLQDAVHERKGTVFLVSGGYGEKSLALPCDVSQALQSESVPAEDVVCKLLDLPSLKTPAPEDRKWIRCLMRDAKDCDRTDVLTFLRKMRQRVQQTDLHLHCKEWDEVLCTEDWNPDDIVARLPEFLQFLKQVQSYLAREMTE